MLQLCRCMLPCLLLRLIVNVAVVMVEAFIVSLNVTVIVLFTSTPVAPLAGIVDEMVGGWYPRLSLW